MSYLYLHQGKPFLKHLELKTCGWHNGRHLENFHYRVWARITILVSSYKSYDHMSPLEGRVHHIDYMLIHLSCMHRDEKLVPSLEVYYTGLKKDGKWRKSLARDRLSKGNWELQMWSSYTRSAWTSAELQEWKGNVCTTFYGSTVSPCPTQGKIMNSFSQHSTSRGHKHWSGTTSSSFQSWTTATPSVINKRQSPFWFNCTINCSPTPHLSMAPNSCQPFTPWAEVFFLAISTVNSIPVQQILVWKTWLYIELQCTRAFLTEICLWLCQWGIQEGMK